jgi:hypothetical protein
MRSQVGSPMLPAKATFWTPDRSELEQEEGFSFFRDTWTIVDVSFDEARNMIAVERAVTTVVDQLAPDEAAFDRIARAVEAGDAEDEPDLLSAAERASLTQFIINAEEDPTLFGGLELGVAGLAYALSVAGMFPAASCRGHTGSRAWSEIPVVFVAADAAHAQSLQPLVEQAGCVFGIDDARPDLLVIEGRSVLDTIRLACLVLDHHESTRTDEARG